MGLWLGLFWIAQAQEPVAEAVPAVEEPAPVTASVHVVYSGALRGVGSGRYPHHGLRWLQNAELIQSVSGHNGALLQGPWVLWTEGGVVQDVLDLLADGDISCGEPSAVTAIETVSDLTLLDSEQPTVASVLLNGEGRLVDQNLRECRSAQGSDALLLGPAEGLPDWQLDAFEFRSILRIETTEGSLWMMGRPLLDMPRITAAVERMSAQSSQTIFVDAGSFVDGASTVRSGELSLHRPLMLDTLAALEPSVLVPGYNELLAGPAGFVAELTARSLPYVATNWSAENSALALPPHAIVPVETDLGTLQIAFLGMLDPALQQELPMLAAEGVTITDPITTIQAATDALNSQPEPPHAVIVLTTASAAILEEARRRLHGVNIMMGDPSFATVRVAHHDVVFRELPDVQKGAPVTVSLDGLAVADLQFDLGGGDVPVLRQLTNTPLNISADDPPDAELSAVITRTRAREYPALDVPLLPALRSDEALSEDQWESIVCEAIRDAAGVDAVFLPMLPRMPTVPGPMTELQFRQLLPTLDTIVIHTVDGAKYSSFLDKTAGVRDLVACGVSKTPGGRSIDSARIYHVATTSRIDQAHIIGSLLAGVAPGRLLDGPKAEPLLMDGHPVTVQEAAVAGLRHVVTTGGGPGAVVDWWVSAPSRKPPLWLLRFRQLSLQLTDFQGTQNDAFSAVPETLATSPSSFTLGSASDVSLEYSDVLISSDIRLRTAYTTLRTEDASEATESADDLRGSASLAIPAWKAPVGTLGLVPYTEVLYDTEFTPTTNEDGSLNSRQADLSLTMGASTGARGWLTGARLGGFANRDMARLTEKPTEFGGKVEWGTSKSINSALTWQTLGDVQVFASTSDDDSSDLRLRALAETRLVMPLARTLNINLYAQGFALKGRVASNADWGYAYTFGASLDVVGAFVL